MKILITEEKFEKVILDYIKESLTPHGGWQSSEVYKKNLSYDDELFFFTIPSRGSGEDEHMWYSLCDNRNLDEILPENECPILTLPRDVFSRLNAFFADYWKPILKEWFEQNTGLIINHIDTQ